MIKIKDTRAVANKQNLRIITTAADATALANTVNTMSNQRRGCTIIHNEQDIFYTGKVRLRGSMFSRGNVSQAGESVTFPADNLFRGTHRTVSVRRSGMNEILVKHAINRAGGLPDNYNDIIQMIGFRADITGPARMEMERFSNSWLDEFYPEGSEGTLFKMEGIRVPTKTFANGTFPAGNPEGIKNLSTDGIGWVVELDLADLGPDGEQYRHGFRWLNNFSRNDNARFVQMCRTMSLPATTPAQAGRVRVRGHPLGRGLQGGHPGRFQGGGWRQDEEGGVARGQAPRQGARGGQEGDGLCNDVGEGEKNERAMMTVCSPPRPLSLNAPPPPRPTPHPLTHHPW